MSSAGWGRCRGGAQAIGVLGYGALAYLLFLVSVLYAIAFLADAVVPYTVDSGRVTGAAWSAVIIDLLLLSAFAIQHSVMARPAFKRWWTRFVPASIERSTYVLLSSLILLGIFWLWQPLPAIVWDVGPTAARDVLWAVYLAGWGLVVLSTFMINHFDLFGLRQVYRRARAMDPAPLGFGASMLYRVVRHPIMTGFFIAFWATPTMTWGHLLFAAVASGYIIVAVRFEEHDLRRALPEYAEYAARTPRFVPGMPAPRR
ncbi:MAG: hypothetical protein L0I76_13140 [Pseudonocardia sp.]|nr:hypothetical protein [Pseudonocardia sp.]